MFKPVLGNDYNAPRISPITGNDLNAIALAYMLSMETFIRNNSVGLDKNSKAGTIAQQLRNCN